MSFVRYALVFLAFAAAAIAPVQAETSAYTDLDLDACEVERVFTETGGADLRCPGLGEVPVFVSDFDARTDVDFGARNEVFDTFAPFNSAGERVEWRLDGDHPFAAILRFKVQTGQGVLPGPDEMATRDVLAVFKVGTPEVAGCPVAYIDAHLNREANRTARQIADAFVRAFRCGVDRATYVGLTDAQSGQAGATVQSGRR